MRRGLVICFVTVASAATARAGMTAYDLNDLVRLRLEDISFFALLLVGCSVCIKLIWNYVAKGIPQWPRISFGRSFALTFILSLTMLLVLSMISGARELLTPNVWRRQGSAYRLNDTASEPLRRQSIDFLRAALGAYAEHHGGKFPSHGFVSEIPEKLWQSPDSVGTRYIYISGLSVDSGTNVLACEPANFGEERFALLANGNVRKMRGTELRRALGLKEPE
jgi:hypothetical protein